MSIDRRTLFVGALAATAALPVMARAATAPVIAPRDPAETVDLWPGTPPGAPAALPVERLEERSAVADRPDRIITGVARPRIVHFTPDRPNGAAVLIAPGGGYRQEAFDNSGYQVANWLITHGYHAFVLIYRLPGEGWADRANVPLADAQRAMRLIRQRAARHGIDAERVATMGFSAGGHVCSDLSTRFATRCYAVVDAADRLSARPFCAAPIYPVVSMDLAIAHPGSREKLLGPNPGAALEAAHSTDRTVTPQSPPHFLVHAEDDATVPVENSLRLRAALRAAGVSVDTHIFAEGGHGFGVSRIAGLPVAAWPELWLGWARRTGLA
ncbi:dienelactone hydrolase [Sphingobium chlorophenolicum L-1]|uniref:Dienelactone hydrolase n=1 Tax=Sphingobium chlorophenolicum L-1 TaxID=690566 RepID=F6F2P6_SPHCR|nr:alpha/beta hydrolase [Sphingobium chlorophenolicum]AEG50708.1 dienelactone hydrolase [Sphingobium chlorophenolicum L-1]